MADPVTLSWHHEGQTRYVQVWAGQENIEALAEALKATGVQRIETTQHHRATREPRTPSTAELLRELSARQSRF